jgi:hypothetical protein
MSSCKGKLRTIKTIGQERGRPRPHVAGGVVIAADERVLACHNAQSLQLITEHRLLITLYHGSHPN